MAILGDYPVLWVFSETEMFHGIWEETLGAPLEVLMCAPLMQHLGHLARVGHNWYLAGTMTGPQATACRHLTSE